MKTACKVHNVRFYNLEPKAISCMAYDVENGALALSRHDASIEIWNLLYTPHLQRTIHGKAGSSVESLGWTHGRLLSTGLLGQLVEWNLNKQEVKHSVQVTGSAAWCLDINNQNTYVAVGTEQGYLNIFSILEDDLQYESIMDKQEGRILCCKYDSSGEFIVTGSVDTVRIWRVKSGQAVHKMSTGRSENNKETIVWCLQITNDFTIISGDSRGKLTFWDGHLGSYIESFQSHKADILSIAVSEDRATLYSAGVDPIISTYCKIEVKTGGKSIFQWVKSIQRKIHEHDVRALVLCGEKLFSGGVDGYLAWSSYPPKILHKYPPLLQNPSVTVCNQARVILLRYTNYLEVWRLGSAKTLDDTASISSNSTKLTLTTQPEKLLEFRSQNDEGITCSAMSANGYWLAYSTDIVFKMYKFCIQDNAPPLMSRVDVLPSKCITALQMCFHPDNNLLALVTRNSDVLLLDLSTDFPAVLQTITTDKVFTNTIHLLKFSPCGTFLVAAALCGGISVWTIKKNKWDLHCSLPKYKCASTAIGVQHKPAKLVAVYADHKVIEYNLSLRKFTTFSISMVDRYPRQWLNRSMIISNVAFDPRNKQVIILHDDTVICVIGKDKELPSVDSKIPRIDSSALSDSMDGFNSDHAFHVLKKYKHLVHLSWLDEDEMVAVEVNPLSLTEQLPPSLSQRQFGTG